jgi:hypothetical protein
LDDGNHLSIKDLKDEVKTIEEKEYEGKQNLIIENLEKCTIIVPFKIKCVYFKNIKNCEIKVAAVENASFINEATDSTFYLASH